MPLGISTRKLALIIVIGIALTVLFPPGLEAKDSMAATVGFLLGGLVRVAIFLLIGYVAVVYGSKLYARVRSS